MRMPKKSGFVAQTITYVQKKSNVRAPKLPEITRTTPNLLLVLDQHRKRRLALEKLL